MDTFRVDLLGFIPCDESELEGRISAAFDINAETSRQFIESVPTVIKENLSEDDTMSFVSALVQCGGQVRVVHEASGEATLYGVDEPAESDEATPAETDDLLDLIEEEISTEAPTWLTSLADSSPTTPSTPPAAGLGGFGKATARAATPGEVYIPPPPSAAGIRSHDRPKRGQNQPRKRPQARKPGKKSGKRSPARWIAAGLIVLATALLVFFLTADHLDLGEVPPDDAPDGIGPEFQLIRD